LIDLGMLVAAFGALIAIAAAFVVAGWDVPTSSQVFLAATSAGQMLLLLGAATLILMRRGEHWPSLGLARPSSWNTTAQLVVGGYVAMFVLNAMIQVGAARFTDLEPPDLALFAGIKGEPALYLGWVVTAWVSAAIGEELLFRGFVWSRVERLIGGGHAAPILALVVQALLFGAGHLYQGLTGVAVTTVVGLVMGGVYLAGRRNLVACILLHGLIDTVSLTVLFLGVEPPAGL
jgi:membrane protease YdiL (CAAX protease family)